MTVDENKLAELRQRLEEERKSLEVQLEDMGVSPQTGAPDDVSFEQGFADSGQATAEKARLLSIAEGLLETLHDVDAALKRMDEGTYGTCSVCGDEIPIERLEARPHANLCMACKQRT